MYFSAMTKFITFFTIVTLMALSLIYNSERAISFESLESKTINNKAVFNSIAWFDMGQTDVWLMNQSHHGANTEAKNLDRLAIVIDKTKTPKVASFYQLDPGPLEWSDKIKVKPYKVSCFVCHTNGLRAMRPNNHSTGKPLNLVDQLKIKMWNTKIKSYGVVVASQKDQESYKTYYPPFKWKQKSLNKKLNIKTCNYCHKKNGFLARIIICLP